MKESGNIHKGHRKRLRDSLDRIDVYSFNDLNYLEMLLTYSIPRIDTNPIAHALLDEFKNIDNIFSSNEEELMTIKGVGENTARFLKLVGALQYYRDKSKQAKQMKLISLKDMVNFINQVLPESKNEQFIIILLRKNLTVETYKVFAGIDHSKISIDVKSVTDFIMAHNTGFCILAHTHPYHFAKPSKTDEDQLEKILFLTKTLGCQVIDNIILGENDFFSFRASKRQKYDDMDIIYNKSSIVLHNLKTGQTEEILDGEDLPYDDMLALYSFIENNTNIKLNSFNWHKELSLTKEIYDYLISHYNFCPKTIKFLKNNCLNNPNGIEIKLKNQLNKTSRDYLLETSSHIDVEYLLESNQTEKENKIIPERYSSNISNITNTSSPFEKESTTKINETKSQSNQKTDNRFSSFSKNDKSTLVNTKSFNVSNKQGQAINENKKKESEHNNEVWVVLDENKKPVKKSTNDKLTLDEFYKLYGPQNRPQFKTLEEQQKWIKEYCEAFNRIKPNT